MEHHSPCNTSTTDAIFLLPTTAAIVLLETKIKISLLFFISMSDLGSARMKL
jgi:hypothetical protein